MSVNAPYITCKFRIPFKHFGESILIRIFSDLHYDADNCASNQVEELFKQCERDIKQKRNIYFLGNGDYNDSFSFTEREHLSVYSNKLNGTTKARLGKIAEQNTLNLYNRMKFMEGRLIGLGEGNHYEMFPTSLMTTTQYLCHLLNCQYLGSPSMIALNFVKTLLSNKIANGCSTFSRYIFMHHGLSSGGKSDGITLNQIGHMTSIASADAYVMSHDHQMAFKKSARLIPVDTKDGLVVRQREYVLIRTGGYQKSYENNMNSFASERLMRPTSFGSPYLIFTPVRHQENDSDYTEVKIDVATKLDG